MRALISVSNKTGLVEFARGLVRPGIRHRVHRRHGAGALAEAGLPVVQVADVTGAPEMMDGRVKTLHPFVHGGILARRDHAGDREALARFGITPIDMVVVNLYPFRETAAKPGTTFDALIEDIDIGGPSMIRARREELQGRARRDLARRLRARARRARRAGRAVDGGPFRPGAGRRSRTRRATTRPSPTNSRPWPSTDGECVRVAERDPLPPRLVIATSRLPHAALRREPAPAGRRGTCRRTSRAADLPAVLQGKELSFTNLLDVDAAARIASEFAEPAAVVIKHTNPCGVATGVVARRGLRARAGRRPALGLRRHRRLQPRDRRGDGAGHRVDVHRGGDRARRSPMRRWPCSRRRRTCASWSRRSRSRAARAAAAGLGRLDLRIGPRRRARPGSGPRGRGPGRVAARRRARGRDEARADGRRVEGPALRVAGVRAREVEHRDLHRRRPDARGRRRADEPRRRRQRRADEGRGRRRCRSPDRWRRPTRSSRSATASTRSSRPGRRPSCSPAGPCATRTSSRRPTSTASRWSSRAAGTSGTEGSDSGLDSPGSTRRLRHVAARADP